MRTCQGVKMIKSKVVDLCKPNTTPSDTVADIFACVVVPSLRSWCVYTFRLTFIPTKEDVDFPAQ